MKLEYGSAHKKNQPNVLHSSSFSQPSYPDPRFPDAPPPYYMTRHTSSGVPPYSTTNSDQKVYSDFGNYSHLGVLGRAGDAQEEVSRKLLDSVYNDIKDTRNLTSEERILELVRLLKEKLTVLHIPPSDYRKFFERYLNRLIKDQGWSSMTVAQALCISVAGAPSRTDSDDSWYRCSYCSLSYPKGKFQCGFCGECFAHVSDLQAHDLEIHQRLAGRSFACVPCNKEFPGNPIALRNHIHERHLCVRNHLECPYGCRTLIVELSEVSLADHITSEHVCSKCHNVVEKGMTEHMDVFHSAQDRQLCAETEYDEGLSHTQTSTSRNSSRKSRVLSPEGRTAGTRSRSPRSKSPAKKWDPEMKRSRSPKKRSPSPRRRLDSPKFSSRRSQQNPSHKSERSRSPRNSSAHRRERSRSRERVRSKSPRSSHHQNEWSSTIPDSHDSVDVKQADLMLVKKVLKNLEARNSANQKFAGEEFHYVDPPNKKNWPQCKMCKLQQPPNVSFSCPKCRQNFSYRVLLMLHMRDSHRMLLSDKYARCEICDRLCENLDLLLLHVTTDGHPCSSNHLQCAYGCLLLFKDKHSLDVHIDSKHEFFCPLCEAPIAGQGKKRHYNLYHPGEDFTLLTDNTKEVPMDIDESEEPVQISGRMTLMLAPRLQTNANQCFLNLAENRRETLLQFPPPQLEGRQLLTKSRNQLINMGFMHCRTCPLVYHPALPSCKMCKAFFLNNTSLSEHQVEVHQKTEAPGIKACVYCDDKFGQYSKLVNHQVVHFCREHSECEFGCKALIVGGDAAVARHNIDARHRESSKPKPALPPPVTPAEKNNQAHQRSSTPPRSGQSSAYGLPQFSPPSMSGVAVPGLNLMRSSQMPPLPEPATAQPPLPRPAPVAAPPSPPRPAAVLTCTECSYKTDESQLVSCEHCAPASGKPRTLFGDQMQLQCHHAVFHKMAVRGELKCWAAGCRRLFKDDSAALLFHVETDHKMCNSYHQRCPNARCPVMYSADPLDSSLDHPEMDCAYITPHLPIVTPNRPEPLRSEGKQWRFCGTCKMTVNVLEIFKCTVCEDKRKTLRFINKDDFIAHLVRAHHQPPPTHYNFSCSICSLKFTSTKKWLLHRRWHAFCEGHVACSGSKCSWIQPWDSKHVHKCSYELQVEKLPCEKTCHLCGLKTTQMEKCVCGLCQGTSVSHSEHLLHLQLHHEHRFYDMKFHCSHCTLSTDTPLKLAQHESLAHKHCHRHQFCLKAPLHCGKMFPALAGGQSQLEHQCYLEKSVTDVGPLIQQLKCGRCVLTTTAVVKLPCPHCRKLFLVREELSAHLVSIHYVRVVGQFVCELCDARPAFVNAPDKLINHRAERHQVCRWHKKCSNSSCNVLFPANLDITLHERTCISGVLAEKHAAAIPLTKSHADEWNATPASTALVDFCEVSKTRPKNPILPSPRKRTLLPLPDLERAPDGGTLSRTTSSKTTDPRVLSSGPTAITVNVGRSGSPGDPGRTITVHSSDRKVAPDEEIVPLMDVVVRRELMCHHCNYTSAIPPEPNRTCKICRLQFQFTHELCAHLMLEHKKVLPPTKKAMSCDLCADIGVQYSVRNPLVFCEHRWNVHRICLLHILCDQPDCCIVFPTKEAAELHLLARQCEPFVPPTGPPPPPAHRPPDNRFNSSRATVSSRSLSDSRSPTKRARTDPPKSPINAPSNPPAGTMELTFDKMRKAKEALVASGTATKVTVSTTASHKATISTTASPKVTVSTTASSKATVSTTASKAIAPEKPKKFQTAHEKYVQLALKYGSRECQSFQVHNCESCSRKFACDHFYRCSRCDNSVPDVSRLFITLLEFLSHLQSNHAVDIEVESECNFCCNFRGNPVALQSHLKTHHQKCTRHFPCANRCPSLFTSSEAAISHIEGSSCPRAVQSPEEEEPPVLKQKPSSGSEPKTAAFNWDSMMQDMLKNTEDLSESEAGEPTKD